MIHKKPSLLIFLLIIFISLNLSAKKKDKYEQWMKDVKLIITKEEKTEFNELKKDKDKEYFIKLFWAKRDPTPLTEKNEFKDEYYRRLNYAKKAFRYGYKTGTETDMGKVYLYFGKPKVFPQGNLEIWVYPTQPWMNLPKETFSFVFSAIDIGPIDLSQKNAAYSSLDRVGYAIDRNQTDSRVMQAFYSIPKKVLLNPDLKKLPEYKKIMTFSPESFEGTLIHKIKTSQENMARIPFETRLLFIKAENLSSYITFLQKIEPGEQKKFIEKKLVFFGRIESETYSSDFRMEKALMKEKDYFISQIDLPAIPGKYNLFLGFYTKDKKVYSIKMDQIEVPNFWDQELALSSLLVSFQVQEKEIPAKKGEFDAFSIGRYSLLPYFSQEYTKDDSLNIFYYIYNIAVDKDQNCSLLIEIELQKGDKKFKLNPQTRKKRISEDSTLLEGTRIPLSVLPESGEYELRVTVTDELSNKTASQKFKFLLL